MKKLLLGSFISLFSLLMVSSCGKTDSGACQPASVSSEKSQMVAYCTANNINYQEHSSGILYQIVSPGSGATLTASSSVSVIYSGQRLDGFVFDNSNNPSAFMQLSNLIDGWKIALPLIQKGGRIKMVIPSSLAWGCKGNGPNIPPNTLVYFDVTLVDNK